MNPLLEKIDELVRNNAPEDEVKKALKAYLEEIVPISSAHPEILNIWTETPNNEDKSAFATACTLALLKNDTAQMMASLGFDLGEFAAIVLAIMLGYLVQKGIVLQDVQDVAPAQNPGI